jgi:hypothetical protein
MKRRSISLAALLISSLVPLFAVSLEESRSASEKLDRISLGKMDPGERITLTQSEINSFLRYDYAELIPEGIRNLRVVFESDTGIVSGRADFSRLSEAQDAATRLLLMMLRGEHDFVARVRYVSADGQARADVDSFQVDGRELEGFALGQPTSLGNNLDQIRLETGQAIVVAREAHAQL